LRRESQPSKASFEAGKVHLAGYPSSIPNERPRMTSNKTEHDMAAGGFHSRHLSVGYFQREGKTFWPIRLVCEQLSVDWQRESEKLQSSGFKPVELSVRLQANGGPTLHACLEQDDFNLWLQTLDADSLSSAARESLQALTQHMQRANRTAEGRAAAKLLYTVIVYRLQNFPEPWSGLLDVIEREFATTYGTTLKLVDAEDIPRALDVLCIILTTLEKVEPTNAYARLDMTISRLVANVGHGHRKTDNRDIAELMSAIEQSRIEEGQDE
jgi:hypothetical protein